MVGWKEAKDSKEGELKSNGANRFNVQWAVTDVHLHTSSSVLSIALILALLK